MSLGSGRGVCRVKVTGTQNTCHWDDVTEPAVLDFAGSDAVLKEDEYVEYPDLQMYPTVAGAVVAIYNLGDAAEAKLVLEPSTLSRIFRGAIYNWRDPEILLLNPGLAEVLPNATIIVSVRQDQSGTTEIWKSSLATFEDQFAMQ
ncbi:hypothetical protein CYMTET_4295, partial [Cymbomonas tetramitiformis]